MLELRPRQRVPAGTTVELWLGISTDEAIRMRTSHDRWMTNRYPLIEAGMSRSDCMNWWQERYDRPLERSACVACPFQSRKRWVETKRRWPELFAEAVEIDSRLRDGLALDKTPYLHTLRRPLAEAVALDEAGLGMTDNETGLGTSARDTAECEVGVKTNDRGLGNPQLHALSPASSVDSRRRSWYVFFFTTPISSAVGSRPSSGAVSVFVWE